MKVMVQGKEHPGYCWLAYEWRNLLLSCSGCNDASRKGSYFPVRKAHVAAHDPTRDDPKDLDALEEPLLLNPRVDDPAKHLSFDDIGGVAALNDDERGKASIEGYRLDLEGHIRARQAAQENAWARIDTLLNNACVDRVDLTPWRSGEAPYSAAVLAYVLPRLRERVDALRRAAEAKIAQAAKLQSLVDG